MSHKTKTKTRAVYGYNISFACTNKKDIRRILRWYDKYIGKLYDGKFSGTSGGHGGLWNEDMTVMSDERIL